MKTTKQFTLLILILLFVQLTHAQDFKKVRGDTVRIKTGNFLLEVSAFDLKSSTLKNADIQSKFSELLKLLKNVNIQEPAQGERICISYSALVNGEELDFKHLHLKSGTMHSKTYVVKDESLLETDFGKYLLEVEDKEYCVRLYTENLEHSGIFSDEFEEMLKEADALLPENRKKTNAWLIHHENKEFTSWFLNEMPPYSLDMLELSAGISTGIIKNQFVTGFNARLGLAFAKKGILKNKYFADYEILYDFTQPANNKPFALNSFVSIGYSRNFSMNPSKDKWYGFSVGYLLGRNSDFFEKNTLKLSIHKQFSNSITLKPEVYIGNTIMPGLKVSIDF